MLNLMRVSNYNEVYILTKRLKKMAYMKDKTLNQIYENFFIDRKEFKTKEKISFFERASLFIPGISFLTSFNINKKIRKEIERAERESNVKIEGYNKGCYDPEYNKMNIYSSIVLSLALAMIIIDPILGFLTFISIFAIIFSCLLGILGKEISTKSLENFINKNNFRKDEALSENDMLLLTQNIDHDILKEFLVEKDFKITYHSLLQLQTRIDNYDALKKKIKIRAEKKMKAENILSVLSSKIKEKEVVNV